MKLMVMHKHDKHTEAGIPPPASLIKAMGELIGGMAQRGKLLDGAGLGASATRSRVTFERGERTVRHGPFSGSDNELPAGFAMVKVSKRDEAIEWASKLGQAIGGDVELEVGKVNEPWDLGIMEKPADAPLRFLIVHKATPASEAGEVRDLGAVTAEMSEQGALVSEAELLPSSRAKRLRWRAGQRKLMDGPFAESKELIGGYAILEMSSLEECIDFCGQYADILQATHEDLEIDIRPL